LTLYKNAFPTTYEEIKRYFPSWYTDVLEMDSIWRAQGKQFDAVRTTIDRIVSNRFLALADESTISELERFIRITPTTEQTLDDRRAVVSAALRGSDNHIGVTEIQELVRRFVNEGEITVSFNNSTVRIDLEKNFINNSHYTSCYNALANIIPAHLSLQLGSVATMRQDSQLFLVFTLQVVKNMILEMNPINEDTLFVLTDENDEILYDEEDAAIMDGLEVTP